MIFSDPQHVFSSLIQEYFFASLYSAIMQSLTSGNASRLATMQNAKKNIEERIDELTGIFNRLRQSSITSELLDIVSGFEMITNQ